MLECSIILNSLCLFVLIPRSRVYFKVSFFNRFPSSLVRIYSSSPYWYCDNSGDSIAFLWDMIMGKGFLSWLPTWFIPIILKNDRKRKTSKCAAQLLESFSSMQKSLDLIPRTHQLDMMVRSFGTGIWEVEATGGAGIGSSRSSSGIQ